MKRERESGEKERVRRGERERTGGKEERREKEEGREGEGRKGGRKGGREEGTNELFQTGSVLGHSFNSFIRLFSILSQLVLT